MGRAARTACPAQATDGRPCRKHRPFPLSPRNATPTSAQATFAKRDGGAPGTLPDTPPSCVANAVGYTPPSCVFRYFSTQAAMRASSSSSGQEGLSYMPASTRWREASASSTAAATQRSVSFHWMKA